MMAENNMEDMKRKAILCEYRNRYGIKDIQDLKKIAMLRAQIESKTIDEIMDVDFPTIEANEKLSDAINLMRSTGYQDIPVLENGVFLGAISYGSILKKKNVPLNAKIKDYVSAPSVAYKGMSLTEVAELMVLNNTRQVPVLSDDKMKIIGCIGRNAMIKLVTDIKALSSIKVWEIMTCPAEFVKDNALLDDALNIMRPLDIRTVPVVNAANNVVGIVGMSEIIDNTWKDSDNTVGDVSGNNKKMAITVESVCKTAVKTINWDDSVENAVALMTEGKFSTLPVVDNGELVGVTTQYDIVQLISACKDRKYLFVQLSGLDDSDKELSVEIDDIINNAVNKISCIGAPESLFINVAKYKEQGERNKYSINAKLIYNGRTVSAKNVDWDLIQTMNGLMRKIIDMVINDKDVKLTYRKRSINY